MREFVHQFARTEKDQEDEDGAEEALDAGCTIRLAGKNLLLRGVIEGALEDVIVNELASPPVLLARDLELSFLRCFADTSRSYQDAAEEFLQGIQGIPLPSQYSEAIPVGTGMFVALLHAGEQFPNVPLLRTKSGFEVDIVGVVPSGGEEGRGTGGDRSVYIQVRGTATRLAFASAVKEIRAATATAIESGMTLSRIGWFGRIRKWCDDVNAADPDDLEAMAIDMSAFPGLSPVLIEASELGKGFEFIADCLDAYFTKAPKKDSILRRIRNATRLLAQADAQEGHSVGLALSVAATEALLCRKGPDLANQFGENVAALLEPDPRFRAKAVSWAKKLYGLRSDVLHGSGFECTRGDISNARLLAAAVLKGIIERRNFLRRMGESNETPDELLSELSKDKYTPGQLTGVEDSPVKLHWRGQI